MKSTHLKRLSNDAMPVPVGSAIGSSLPLCVDLDGTLIATDSLWECILVLIKKRPQALISIFLWMLRGKAFFKKRIAEVAQLECEHLPYRNELLQYLRAQRERGRTLVLATAADSLVAESVAKHLGFFDIVMSSDGERNLNGQAKARALVESFGSRGFDYIGNSSADLPVWAEAHAALIVSENGSAWLPRQAGKRTPVEKVFAVPSVGIRSVVRAMRLYQWIKNLLIFVPLVLAHRFRESDLLLTEVWAFIAFGCCASGLYILNDLFDLTADRQHPRKRRRPFAAGEISIPAGLGMAAGLICGSMALAIGTLPIEFTLILICYMVATNVYTFYARRVPVLDVMTLAGLFTIRVLAGGVAVNIPLSSWLLAFSMFMFLSLAFMKRYTELGVWQESGSKHASGRGYLHTDREWLASVGTAAGYLSVLVMALYINGSEEKALYQRPAVLWVLCPLLLFWITRLWFLANRRLLVDDPIEAAAKDKGSYAVGLAMFLAWWYAM